MPVVAGSEAESIEGSGEARCPPVVEGPETSAEHHPCLTTEEVARIGEKYCEPAHIAALTSELRQERKAYHASVVRELKERRWLASAASLQRDKNYMDSQAWMRVTKQGLVCVRCDEAYGGKGHRTKWSSAEPCLRQAKTAHDAISEHHQRNSRHKELLNAKVAVEQRGPVDAMMMLTKPEVRTPPPHACPSTTTTTTTFTTTNVPPPAHAFKPTCCTHCFSRRLRHRRGAASAQDGTLLGG